MRYNNIFLMSLTVHLSATNNLNIGSTLVEFTQVYEKIILLNQK